MERNQHGRSSGGDDKLGVPSFACEAIAIFRGVKFHQPGEYEFRWRTASLAKNPIAGVPASLPMITKGGPEAALRSLASEYA